MAKYRCPRCGASHKTFQDQCRLCGQSMNPDFPVAQPVERRDTGRDNKGTGALVAGGLLLVVLMGVVLWRLGVVAAPEEVERVAANVPVIGAAREDGWQTVTDPDGPATFTQPGTPVKTTDDDTTTWTAWVGRETRLTVSWAPTDGPPDDVPVDLWLDEQAEAYTETLGAGAEITTISDLGISGAPAVAFEVTRTTIPVAAVGSSLNEEGAFVDADGNPAVTEDTDAFAKVFLIYKNGKLYTVQELSQFRGGEHADRMASSLQIG